MVTKSIIDQLDEAEKAATPGPWLMSFEDVGSQYASAWANKELGRELSIPDLNLVDLTRNNIRALIDIAKAAEELRDALFPRYLKLFEDHTGLSKIPKWAELDNALAKLESNNG